MKPELEVGWSDTKLKLILKIGYKVILVDKSMYRLYSGSKLLNYLNSEK